MTTKQILRKRIRDAKHQMFLAKPLRGYMGNQYNYWKSEKEKNERELKSI